MYRVALNTAITQVKKTGFFQDERSKEAPTYDAESEMDMSEDIKLLYRAISSLKKVDRALILLWLEERSYEEIADAIGISVKNVSVKLVRIKSRLAEQIKKMQ